MSIGQSSYLHCALWRLDDPGQGTEDRVSDQFGRVDLLGLASVDLSHNDVVTGRTPADAARRYDLHQRHVATANVYALSPRGRGVNGFLS
jgi:hypothetical protein